MTISSCGCLEAFRRQATARFCSRPFQSCRFQLDLCSFQAAERNASGGGGGADAWRGLFAPSPHNNFAGYGLRHPCVAVSGVVGFVGLIIPHMIRLAAGPDHRTLLPCSFLGGGVFLCVMDTLSRCLFPPIELPVGVLCAICGVPFFLSIMKRYAKGGLDG